MPLWGQPLDFLMQHADKEYSPDKWATLLGVKICDPDGWRGCGKEKIDGKIINYGDPHTLQLFIKRLKPCTIAPADPHPLTVSDNNGNKVGTFGKW